jgi:hypothetical protein
MTTEKLNISSKINYIIDTKINYDTNLEQF